MYEDFYVEQAVGGSGIFDAFGWLVVLAVYVYFSFMIFRIAANKTGHAHIAWFAFVPILNTVLLIKMSGKPMYWFIFLLIPLVNIVTFFILWIEVAKGIGQSAVWGFLMMIPFLNFLAVFVLAYGTRDIVYNDPTPPTNRQRSPRQIIR